jgi:hypothetical protein
MQTDTHQPLAPGQQHHLAKGFGKYLATGITISCLWSGNLMAEIKLAEGVSLGGLVEIEAGYEDTADETSSDISLVTVELALDAQKGIVSGHTLLLYEGTPGDDKELNVDEATISLDFSPFSVTAGLTYVPFGNFETHLVSDPFTLELGETANGAVILGFEQNGLYASLYAFKGDTSDGGDSHIDQLGATLGYTREAEGFDFDIGLGYINNLADSNSLADFLADDHGVDTDDLDSYVGALNIHAIANMGAFSIIGEYMRAQDAFQPNEWAWQGRGAKPQAWNLEAAYHFNLAGKEATVALAYQGSDEAVGLLPESAFIGGVSVGIYDNTSLAMEWRRSQDYSLADGGSDTKDTAITLQLAYEF